MLFRYCRHQVCVLEYFSSNSSILVSQHAWLLFDRKATQILHCVCYCAAHPFLSLIHQLPRPDICSTQHCVRLQASYQYTATDGAHGNVYLNLAALRVDAPEAMGGGSAVPTLASSIS